MANKNGKNKSDLDIKIAQTSCAYLEQFYREIVIGGVDTKRREKVFEAFERQVMDVVISYKDDMQVTQTLNKLVIWDQNRRTYPFFVLLLLFKAGMHREALEYCKISNLVDVVRFGETILSRYVETNG